MKKIMCLSLYLIFIFPIIVKASDLTITPIDYSGGDSAILESNGKYLLMDVGEGDYDGNDPSKNTVIKYLDDNNITKFDLYLSHYHGDHYGGNKKTTISFNGSTTDVPLFQYIMSLNGTKYTIENVYIPQVPDIDFNPSNVDTENITNSDLIYLSHYRFKKTAEVFGINCIELEENSTFKLGKTNAKVLFLNQDFTIENVINNSSLVTKFTTSDKKVSFLTAGDIEQWSENQILSKGIDVSADIFKLSHHGTKYNTLISNTPAFLKAVSPKYTYLQLRYKHANFTDDLVGGGYYYVDEINKIKLSDIANVYSNYNSKNAKFVINSGTITPVMNNETYGKTITLEFVDFESSIVA